MSIFLRTTAIKRYIKYLYSTLFIFLTWFAAQGQDRQFARQQIAQLTSFNFAGRGYVDQGDFRAAKYISDMYREIGLKQWTNNYFQHFTLSVNTFPGSMKVEVDGKELRPGDDYLVQPGSSGAKKTKYRIQYADSTYIFNCQVPLRKRTALVIDESELKKTGIFEQLAKVNPSAIIELKNGKLIWSVSRTKTSTIPWVQVSKNVFPREAKKLELDIDALYEPVYQSQNVAGYIEGSKYPDSFIVLSAHYDHLGKMGLLTYFPGANDNASGVAMMLDLARYYRQPENRPLYSIAFIAFGAEEAGLVGSKYFTDYPLIPLSNISFLINMDLMANGQDGMTVVNGEIFPAAYNTLVELNEKHRYLKEIKKRGKAANSDHYWFSEKGVRAFFFYLLGDYPHYHDIHDTVEKPTLAGYDGAFRLIQDFIEHMQKQK